MIGLVIVLLIGWLVAAFVGTVVTGLLWLTLAALAGVLMTGAVGLAMRTPQAEGSRRPAAHRPRLSVVASTTGGVGAPGGQDATAPESDAYRTAA